MPLDSDDGDDDLFAPSNGASSLLALLDDAVTATSAPIDVSALVKAEPEHLDFVGRGIGDAGLSELATALSETGDAAQARISTLDLERNALSDDGALALADIISDGGLPNLELLSLSDNPIGVGGILAIGRLLSSRDLAGPRLPRLAVLNLNACAVGDDGLVALGVAIQIGALASLKKLFVSRCGCGDPGLLGFSHALGSARVALPALYELWLSNNRFTDAGARAFFEALASGAMASLGDLRLQFNRCGDGLVSALATAAERGALSSLWYLGLNDNHFSDAGLATLATMLVDGALPRLEFVTASSEQSSDEAQLAVQNAFTRRPRPTRPCS